MFSFHSWEEEFPDNYNNDWDGVDYDIRSPLLQLDDNVDIGFAEDDNEKSAYGMKFPKEEDEFAWALENIKQFCDDSHNGDQWKRDKACYPDDIVAVESFGCEFFIVKCRVSLHNACRLKNRNCCAKSDDGDNKKISSVKPNPPFSIGIEGEDDGKIGKGSPE